MKKVTKIETGSAKMDRQMLIKALNRDYETEGHAVTIVFKAAIGHPQSISELCEKTKLSKDKVRNAVNTLKVNGLLIRDADSRSEISKSPVPKYISNTYML